MPDPTHTEEKRMKKAKKTRMRPRDARTFEEQCRMESDNKSTAEGWITIDGGTVHLYSQRLGEQPTGSISVSKRTFNAWVDWYMREQELRDA